MPRTRRTTAWWEDRAEDLCRLGSSQFAARHGVAPSTVSWWRQKLKVPSPPQPGARSGAWWREHAADLRRLPNRRFAARHRVTLAAVSRWRKWLGIPSPVPRGAAPRADWSALDWRLNDTILARALGVSRQAVGAQRKKVGRPRRR